MRMVESRRLRILLGLAPVLSVGVAHAKPPQLDRLFPPGAVRGQTVSAAAAGTFDHWPPGVWVGGGGVSIQPSSEKGQLTISVAADAQPGRRWVRLYDDEGASAPRPFLVGTLPEVLEIEPNDEPARPQRIELGEVTVNGRLARRGDVDGFEVALRRGQTLVAALEANRHLGSPMDGVLQVVAPGGFVLAQNDDDRGLDPFLVFEAPADGAYLVRTFAFPATPDSTIAFAGGDAFVYRLTLTTGGWVDHPFPLTIGRDAPRPVELRGWNIPDDLSAFTADPTCHPDEILLFHPRLANTATVLTTPYRTGIESGPSDADRPQTLSVPCVVTGRIDPAGDEDVYKVALEKGQVIRFGVESRGMGFPVDPALSLLDPAGKLVAEVDDSGRRKDPELAFQALADGDHLLVVRELFGHGGPRYVYRLSTASPVPDYHLSMSADQFTAAPGKPATIRLAVIRRNGFDRPILIGVEGLPDELKVDPVTAEGTASFDYRAELGQSREIKVPAGSRGFSGPIRLVGRARGGPAIVRTAAIALPGSDAALDDAWLTILTAAPEASKTPKAKD